MDENVSRLKTNMVALQTVVIKELVRLAKNAENETTRVAAIRELLDRAYGKAPMSMQDDESNAMAAFFGFYVDGNAK